MKIELFMENPTDSFYQSLHSDHVNTRLGAKTAYKPTATHSFMNNKIDGLLELPEGKLEIKLSIRKENNLGYLLLNRSTGHVYSLDRQAVAVVDKLLAGNTPSIISQSLDLTIESIYTVVDILRNF